jgi:hypothetical protein
MAQGKTSRVWTDEASQSQVQAHPQPGMHAPAQDLMLSQRVAGRRHCCPSSTRTPESTAEEALQLSTNECKIEVTNPR